MRGEEREGKVLWAGVGTRAGCAQVNGKARSGRKGVKRRLWVRNGLCGSSGRDLGYVNGPKVT